MRLAHLAVVALAAMMVATSVSADVALDAYRALAGSGEARQVLAFTRGAIERAMADQLDAAHDSAAAAVADSLDWPGAPCGVIVSLARGPSTRACVGSLTPLGGGLGRTLQRLAAQIVASDPRHPPVRRDELGGLRVIVAFTSPPASVADPLQISPAREGLLISTARGAVAYLPGEARTIAWALREARRAGVLERREDASFQRFTAVVIREPASPPKTSEESTDASP